MYTVTIEQTFTAAHAVTMPDNTREPLHEHKWLVKVAISTPDLDEFNMAVDFLDLQGKLAGILDPLHGKTLENLPHFPSKGATAELVAKYIHDSLAPALPEHATLDYTEVMEEKGCWAKYSK